MPKNQLDIPILDDVSLQVYPVGEAKPSDEQETTDEGGLRWQLEEGKEYEYEFVGPSPDRLVGWYLDGPDALIQRNPHHKSRGRIVTGVYVGTAQFKAVNEKTKENVPASTKYPLSADKILRMYYGATDNGFTSFAEA